MAEFIVEALPIANIRAYPGNPRTITDAAVDAVAASLKTYGWRQPIVVDADGVIVVGHTRYLAAQKLGLQTVPVHCARELDAAQIKAYRLADNRTHEEAMWDLPALADEFRGLQDIGFDLALTGFNDADFARALGTVTHDATQAWDDMPDSDSETRSAFRSIIVHFASQEAVDEFAQLIGQEFTSKTKWIWHPDKAYVSRTDHQYLTEDEAKAAAE